MAAFDILFWVTMILGVWTVVSSFIIIILTWLSKGPAWILMKQKMSKKPLIVVFGATSQIQLKIVREVSGFLEVDKNEYLALPKVPSVNPHPNLADYAKERGILNGKIVYFVAEGKSIALTPKILVMLNRVKPSMSAEEKTGAAEKLKGKVKVNEGTVLSFDVARQLFSKMYLPSVIRAISLTSEDIGRDEAGFNFGKLMMPLGIFLGMGFLLFVVYIIGAGMGVFQ